MNYEYNLRLQSLPILGSGQRHRFNLSQIAFPGQSLSLLQVTISLHLVWGSGSGILPSGHSQLYDPGVFLQIAPTPQEFGFVHSSKSAQVDNGLPVKPAGHSQVKLPGVFVQIAFEPHLPLGPLTLSHSSISIQPAAISLGLKVQPSSQIQYASCPSGLQNACSPHLTSSQGALH